MSSIPYHAGHYAALLHSSHPSIKPFPLHVQLVPSQKSILSSSLEDKPDIGSSCFQMGIDIQYLTGVFEFPILPRSLFSEGDQLQNRSLNRLVWSAS